MITAMANNPTTIFSVSDAYVFSPNGNAEVRTDGLKMEIPRGSYKNVRSSPIMITSNETVIVGSISNVNRYELAQHAPPAGIRNPATYPLPANRLELTFPRPKPCEAAPSVGFGLDTMLIAAAGFAAAKAAAVFILEGEAGQARGSCAHLGRAFDLSRALDQTLHY